MKQPVQVTVLGQPLTVRTDASPEEVHQIAAYVNVQVAEIMASGQTADTLNAAVLALMNMSGAYLRQRSKAEEAGIAARLERLLHKLEAALPEERKE